MFYRIPVIFSWMSLRRVNLHTPVSTIFGDEFRVGLRYTNWRPEGSGDWLLIYTESGSGRIVSGEREYFTRPGEILLYEPKAIQDYGTNPGVERWHLLWTHFMARPLWQPWLQWPSLAPRVRLVALPSEMRSPCRDALRRMVRACRIPGSVGTELAMTALKEAILWGRMACSGDLSIRADPRIARAVALLTDHFKEPFNLPDLARRCGLSVSRFSYLFRQAVGQTPGQLVEQLRLSHAGHLLRLTFLNVGEISAQCGFQDPFYFTNRFRKRYGLSPRLFRAKSQQSKPGLATAGSTSRRLLRQGSS